MLVYCLCKHKKRKFFFFKQKTAYEIGTGDWSSDVCLPISGDLVFLIGGADGLAPDLRRPSGGAVSLGRMVWPDRKSVV